MPDTMTNYATNQWAWNKIIMWLLVQRAETILKDTCDDWFKIVIIATVKAFSGFLGDTYLIKIVYYHCMDLDTTTIVELQSIIM